MPLEFAIFLEHEKPQGLGETRMFFYATFLLSPNECPGIRGMN